MRFSGFAIPRFVLLLLVKQVATDSVPACSPEAFTFPDVLGAEVVSITASLLQGFKGYTGYKPESAFIRPTGVTACNVTVSYTHRYDDDLVSVQIWLPAEDYNGRFVGVGGGGWRAGDTGQFGYDMMSALVSQGYAVATTNAGYEHDVFSRADSWLMQNGKLNRPLMVNFARRALNDLPVIAKHTVKTAYGSDPKFSYWHGCSTGGRQGLTIASYWPWNYDGVLTGCPAVNFPALLPAMYWPQFVMNQMGVYPPACEFEAIVAATVETCDEVDGVKDGIVSREDLCNFDPDALVRKKIDCQGSPTTISKEAVSVYKSMREGPVDTEGNQLFPGITLGTAVVGLMSTANTLCEGSYCTRGLPFTIADDWIRLLVQKDPSFDLSKISHSEYVRLFRDSVFDWDGLFSSNSPDLRRFNMYGQKMITWHSINDEAVPVKATRQYYESVVAFDKRHKTTTQDYYRYFEVPGATHCGSPPGSPYPLHALKTLEAWVEEGIAPGELPVILIGDESGKPIPHRVCAYPDVAVFENGGYVCKPVVESVKDDREHSRDEL